MSAEEDARIWKGFGGKSKGMRSSSSSCHLVTRFCIDFRTTHVHASRTVPRSIPRVAFYDVSASNFRIRAFMVSGAWKVSRPSS